tara:strand:- start:105 stop:437 length:333 start_codon:yes stop_codon:yes gene_type:complete
MKKITLSAGLIAGIMFSNAQDTIKTMVSTNFIFEWDWKTGALIKDYRYNGSFSKNIKENQVLCLWLFDDIDNTRVVTTIFPSGKTTKDTLISKDNQYFSPIGPFRIKIDK